MVEEHLNSLVFISIENDIITKLDLNETIQIQNKQKQKQYKFC